MSYQLELHNVFKLFGSVKAVDDVSLNIEHGEFLTLLGPSGSGKTTTLNMIAGFEIPTRGDILLENKDITTVAPNRRGIGMVFQNYALFPHMTVYDNIAFPLKMRKIAAAKIRTMTRETLELVKLPGFDPRYPHQLSGGQQQRIALARAIVFYPKMLQSSYPHSLRHIFQTETKLHCNHKSTHQLLYLLFHLFWLFLRRLYHESLDYPSKEPKLIKELLTEPELK